MLLTKKSLRTLQESMRATLSEYLERELLDKYGKLQLDDEGHIYEYTEQDIYEQVGKLMREHRNENREKIIAS